MEKPDEDFLLLRENVLCAMAISISSNVCECLDSHCTGYLGKNREIDIEGAKQALSEFESRRSDILMFLSCSDAEWVLSKSAEYLLKKGGLMLQILVENCETMCPEELCLEWRKTSVFFHEFRNMPFFEK
ncbi:MAG: hypothetical protein CMO55_17050 [Verrucomicrobiales bacterium]|nr:hypothetical protein [Verrucomicrobiales bacterium]